MEFIKKEKDGILYYELKELKEAGFMHMFTTVKGGVSFDCNELNFGTSGEDTKENVTENFRRALKVLDSDCENAVRSKQTHSDVVLTVDKNYSGCGILREHSFFEADGLITDEKDLSLVIFYADCVPVIIADTNKKVIGAVHSGWRGTEKNIVFKAIEKMCNEKDCNTADMIVAIGPCIGVCHFEVDKNIYDIFVSSYSEEYGNIKNGKYFVNLGKIVSKQVRNCGVPKEKIAFLDKCTFCNEEFYSYRRQKERAGRMAAIIRI